MENQSIEISKGTQISGCNCVAPILNFIMINIEQLCGVLIDEHQIIKRLAKVLISEGAILF